VHRSLPPGQISDASVGWTDTSVNPYHRPAEPSSEVGPMPMDTHQDPRTAIVTGATSGVGRALAERLAAAGLTVGLVARDRARGQAARDEIAAATGNDRVGVLIGDLSDLASVRDLARAAADANPTIDILVNCAGVYTAKRSVTRDGFETMFATNVLGPFLLTNLLVPELRAAESARILVLSAPSGTKLDFEDLQHEHSFRSLSAFGASKAADLLFTFELARRLDGTGVTANAVHPGLVHSNLMDGAFAPLRWAIRPFESTPEKAVTAIVPLVLDPAFADQTGKFFHKAKAIDPPASTRDAETQRRLWDACAAMTGI
jgi:NAD(P)-dependent dehydrogenase (short-subunit alcohol dehydrogenase family)